MAGGRGNFYRRVLVHTIILQHFNCLAYFFGDKQRHHPIPTVLSPSHPHPGGAETCTILWQGSHSNVRIKIQDFSGPKIPKKSGPILVPFRASNYDFDSRTRHCKRDAKNAMPTCEQNPNNSTCNCKFTNRNCFVTTVSQPA